MRESLLGAAFNVSTDADFRSAADHDVDRLLYSSAYRRLSGVTQVVAVGEHQLFHNRLAHTQKVAQLSRRIAEHLNWNAARQNPEDGVIVEPAVAEAAGLAHDLGHPPFGHIAERQLDKSARKWGADGYEGNAQSFRIVTKLAVRRDGVGLGLSEATLDGILKYPWLSSHAYATEKHKWGAYESERKEFLEIRSDGADVAVPVKSMAAEIMDWADDISYAVHDLEDFFRTAQIPLDTLLYSASPDAVGQDQTRLKEFVGRATSAIGVPPGATLEEENERNGALLRQVASLTPPLQPFDGSITARKQLNRFAGLWIDQFVTAASVGPDGRFTVDSDTRRIVDLLKQFTRQYVINDSTLASLQRGQIRVVRELFDLIMTWINEEVSERTEQRLPPRLLDLLDNARREWPGSANPAHARATADYISSLTEDQALDLHARLTGRGRLSISDSWMAG
ncbi:deoxyguanosinetriphosphate triphosphohydrolase family protein [Curtobacterium flaccumfaciens]|uniref:deoxyguanosinetriphosphate triphosphohydrolase family protein n=1 Tax=Curtobacterium flaccumfaciens TaxID=2035 RepID=UPI0026585C0B|nr:dNTP triphosphohydrolase [Curtobacterium flaccumfaciens]MCS5517824.1 dNTP triphosphohydrolase [Curtobacterium flaccumfaciens]